MMKAEDLKNSVLQMAMQGKLVPQDPNDEPASELLEKIKQEKEQLIKNKKIKRNNKESTIWKENEHWYEKIGKNGDVTCIDKEIPFEIPNNWIWVRLGYMISVSSGKNLTSKKMNDNFDIPVYGGNGITGYYTEFNLDEKTLIIGRVGAKCGNVHIVSGKSWITDNAFITTYPKCCLNMNFLKYLLIYMNLGSYSSSTAQPVISGKKIYPLLFQLPPLNEQKRIVERLEQILPQIEQYGKYEEQLTKLNEKFPDKLKKSILQQAIQGKLVPQNPEEEPATKLLEKIKQEKEQLIKDKKIKRNKNESTIYKKDGHWYEVIDKNNEVKCIDDEIPFEIPKTWVWTRLGQISNYQYNHSINSEDISDDEWVLDLKDIEKDSGKLLNYTTKKEIKSKSKKYIFYKNDVLYCKLRPYLNKVLIADKKGYSSSEIIPITFYGNIVPQYAQLVLMSPYFVNFTTKKSYGTKMPRLGTNDAINILLPLAPIEEESKIIEKTKSLLNVIK